MPREDSPFVYGEYWLDKRRDGKAADVWQIAWYEPGTRQVRYRSTKRKSLEDARGVIKAHEETATAKGPQKPDDAKVLPLLFNYWEEHGCDADSSAQIASSIRQFIGFLMQDVATPDVTVAQLNSLLFERFRKWRMAPHSYDVPWGGKDYRHSSRGVSGEAVQRNLDDIRAGLNHNTGANARLPWVPKVPSVPEKFRSPPRDLIFTRDQMGAIIGYSAYSIETLRFVLLMMGTLCRPEAALAMDPARQYRPDVGVIDLHPPSWPRTKKHNAELPVIPELRPWLEAWAAKPHKPVLSRKVWWRTMRKNLGLPVKAEPKTIRHTVATRLRTMRVPFNEIETALGHLVLKRTSRVYAKYDPDYLLNVSKALSIIWADYCDAAHEWLAVHSLSTPKRGVDLTVVKNGAIPTIPMVGGDGLEPPTLSV
jgi:integrase